MRKVAGEIAENSLEIISKIIRTVTGLETISIQHISSKGMSNAVTVATTRKGRLVVRTNVESHLLRFQREEWVVKQLNKTPVATPEILGCGIEENTSYSVAWFIEGSAPAQDEIGSISVWQTLGEYASHLNKIKPPKLNEAAVEYFTESWEDQINSDVEIIFKNNFWVEKGEITIEEQVRLREYLLGNALIEAPHGVCQFDLSIGNALICKSNQNKIYIMDFEWVNIAPVPFYQLACVLADKGQKSEISNAFLKGYGLTEKQIADYDQELNRFILQRVMRATAWARDRCPSLIEANLIKSKPIISKTISEYLSR